MDVSVSDRMLHIDGHDLFCKIFRPVLDHPVPLILFGHPLGSSYLAGVGFGQILSRLGLGFAAFDFRGGSPHSKSDGSTRDMSVFTEADDFGLMLKAVRDWDWVDPKKVVLMGASQGGAAVSLYGCDHPDQSAAMILLYPALVIPDDLHRTFHDTSEVPERFNLLSFFPAGKKYVLDGWNWDPFSQMKNYPHPVLIIHGARDSLVPLSYSEKAAASFPDATLHIARRSGHGFVRQDQEQVFDWIVSFLIQNRILNVPGSGQ